MKLLKNLVFYISVISLSIVSVVTPFILTKYNKPSSFNTPVLEVKEEDVDEKFWNFINCDSCCKINSSMNMRRIDFK
ncbi:MAG: hypothetical protein Ta2E_08680 [Mycoplasmoidaceae bacterium]|nr:MAG: hypothetical protein Ta2E_08680 [Mycoplasmoidaceae bacterium]